MITIDLTKEQVEAYNSNQEVLIYNEKYIKLSITRDTMKTYNFRDDNNKKFACYLPSRKDIQEINTGDAYIFYYGKVEVALMNKTGLNLIEGLI